MNKLLLFALAFSALSLGSCMKSYTCTCPDWSGGTYIAGSMSAMTKTEANRGCRAMGADEGCRAE